LKIKDIQQEQLSDLVKSAKHTDFGQKHDFESIKGFRDFAERLPISFYENIQPQIKELKQGKQDIFWPGKAPALNKRTP
jgi:hypothetical protein